MQTISRALLAAAPSKPPSEFRIFSRGVNKTSKGDFTFDLAAATSVMACYRKQGVDMIVDREHDSLSEDARVARSNAGDALAHFKLAMRNGELWATNVAWNSEGESDLASKTRRYTSPAFLHDKDGRITELLNVALVSMPATYNNAALIAASKYGANNSRVVSARFPHAALSQLERCASRRRLSCADLIRRAVAQLAAGDKPATDTLSVLADVAAALGLPADAAPADVLAAVKALLDAIGPSDAPPKTAATPPKASPPKAPAPKGNTAPGALSRAEYDARRAGLTVAEFETAKRAVMRRTPEKRAK